MACPGMQTGMPGRGMDAGTFGACDAVPLRTERVMLA